MLYVTLKICCGASYLDMVSYQVDIKLISSLFLTFIGEQYAILTRPSTMSIPTVPSEIMLLLVENWAAKQKGHHGFTTNMGTGWALDTFVIEMLKPLANDLNSQKVACFRNRMEFGDFFQPQLDGCDNIIEREGEVWSREVLNKKSKKYGQCFFSIFSSFHVFFLNQEKSNRSPSAGFGFTAGSSA